MNNIIQSGKTAFANGDYAATLWKKVLIFFMLLPLALAVRGQSYSDDLYVKACFGDIDAQIALGDYYWNSKDYEHAIEWYSEASTRDVDWENPSSVDIQRKQNEIKYILGKYYYEKEEYESAVYWWEKTMSLELCVYAPALCDLANCYYNGYGVDKNLVEAYRLYRMAAYRNSYQAQKILEKLNATPEMQYNLAEALKKDCEYDAIQWYQKAAEKNYKDSKQKAHDLKQAQIFKIQYKYVSGLEQKGQKDDVSLFLYAMCFYRAGGVLEDCDKMIEILTRLASLLYQDDVTNDNWSIHDRGVIKNTNVASGAMYHLAQFYERQGDTFHQYEYYDKAVEWYRKILQKCKKNSWLYNEVIERLYYNPLAELVSLNEELTTTTSNN